jgi:hypothetical protein
MAWFRRDREQSVVVDDAARAELATLRAEVERLRALVANPPPAPTPPVVNTPPPPTPGMSLADVNQRITNTTTELARQLDELSHEMGSFEELRAAQERLATEQVRYDLALRAELAAVADELRRRGR